MRIVLTGSGSGGHFYPLIAIAEALQQRAKEGKQKKPELYLLAPEPYDEGVLFKHQIHHVRIPAGKVRRYFSFKNITDVVKTVYGILLSLYKLFVLYPDVVVSKGSYTSVPVVIAAAFLRIPIVVHDSDVKPGRANKLAARFAHTIAISYKSSASFFPQGKTFFTGIPLRSELMTPPEDNPYRQLGFESNGPLVVVFGGSQGAERINDIIVTSLNELLPLYTVLHQTGDKNTTSVNEMAHALVEDKSLLKKYITRGFLDVKTLHATYQTAGVIISRAGSNSIHEIAITGKPSILIPIPEEISHDQRLNAYEYARTGAASVIEEKNLTPHLLTAEITRIMNDHTLQVRMGEAAKPFAPRNAATVLATLIADITATHTKP